MQSLNLNQKLQNITPILEQNISTSGKQLKMAPSEASKNFANLINLEELKKDIAIISKKIRFDIENAIKSRLSFINKIFKSEDNNVRVEKLKQLRKEFSEIKERESFLHIEVNSRDPKLVSDVKRIDLNHLDSEERTPLHLASALGLEEIVTRLIQAKANVDAQDNKGWTPLHHAIHSGHVKVVQILINNGANIHMVNNRRDAPIHFASEEKEKDKDPEILSYLLENTDADVNALNYFCTTPIHCAVSARNVKAARLLIKKGANTKCTDQWGYTPILRAEQNGYEDMVSCIKEAVDLRNKLKNKQNNNE